MKKKIVMAIAVLGMAFAGQAFAQDENARLSPPRGPNGEKWATYTPLADGMVSCVSCAFYGDCLVAKCAG